MNVSVENLAPCRKLLRFEIEAKDVDAAFDLVISDYQKAVSLPGFRPGRAPRDMVLRRFQKDIEHDVKERLIRESYRRAVEENKIAAITPPDIEEIQFGRGQPMLFAATVETAPEIPAFEYKGLPVRRQIAVVTEADMERALNLLRERHADFRPVARQAQLGDVVVVNYTGTCDGKPISETAPGAKSLTSQKNFWISTSPGMFLPGFAEQLIGTKAGDKLTVTVDFPADFATKELAGKKGVFEVEVVEVRERVLPPLDDDFAKAWGAENMEKLKEGVRRDLENELKYKQQKDVRNQLIRQLLARANFDLPETAVAMETRNVVYDIVRENAQRGVSRELIEKQKEQIYAAAASSAKDRVKIAFLFQKIAEKEQIEVSDEELTRRIRTLAAIYQISLESFLKDLKRRDGFSEIYEQILNEKVMDFLEANARIEDVPAQQSPG